MEVVTFRDDLLDEDLGRWTKRLGVVFQCHECKSVGEWFPEASTRLRLLASNRLDTVGAMIEEMVRRASAQSAAAG